MISFWIDQAGRWTIDDYLSWRAQAVRDAIQVRCYEDLRPTTPVGQHPQIFTAIDTLSSAGRQAVTQVWDTLRRAAPDVPLYNDPRRVLMRFDLLRAMQREGINPFHVTRATEALGHRWFPAFVRLEHRHTGPLTGLLASRAQVCRALAGLMARGRRLEDLIIVEFVDVQEADGLYRRYSVTKVGDVVLPRFVHIGSHWAVKSVGDPYLEMIARAERAFFDEHPHEQWARRVFEMAGIDFGRIDYGVARGEPQVWEINTGATLGRGPAAVREALDYQHYRLRSPTQDWFHEQFVAALGRLAAQHGTGVRPILEVQLGRIGDLTRAAEHARRRSLIGWLDSALKRAPLLDRLVRRWAHHWLPSTR